MQVGVIGGICLLAFLLSKGKAEDSENLKESKSLPDVGDKVKEAVGLKKDGEIEAPSDLKNELNLDVNQSNFRVNEGKPGDIAKSDDHSVGDSAVSNESSSSNSDSSGSSPQSKAAPFNPFNQELGPYIPPGSSFSQAEAQAINGNVYDPGVNSYPYSASYPYGPGLGLAQSQAENELYQPSPNLNLQNENGLYQPSPNLKPQAENAYYLPPPILIPQADNGFYQREPVYNPYQGFSSVQAQHPADKGLYQPRYTGLPNASPYYQGSSFPPMPGQSDSESQQSIIEPISMLPKPDRRLNPAPESLTAFFSSYPYSLKSSSSSATTQFQDNSGPYQPIPIPNPDYSPYEHLLIPYEAPNPAQAHRTIPLRPDSKEHDSTYGSTSSHAYGHNEPYQAIPVLDPNPSPYDSILVPYRDPNFPHAQTSSEKYQPLLIPKFDPNQQESISRLFSESSYSVADYPLTDKPLSLDERGSYQAISIPDPEPNDSYKVPYIESSSSPNDSYKVPYIESSSSQEQIYNGSYQPIPTVHIGLNKNLTQDGMNPYQSVPEPDANSYESTIVPLREKNKNAQGESFPYKYQPIPKTYDPKSGATFMSSVATHDVAQSGEHIPVTEDTDSSIDLESKGWVPFEHNPFPPNGPKPQLYPSGAETAQGIPDFKAAANGVVQSYSQGISQFPSDYPSESPYRPGDYKTPGNESQGPTNDLTGMPISPIALEGAASRVILPFEYVFPNKMPGGENTIQCTKENEFHHFWSKELDCLVCICLNEYGLLSPVCARCGGCHNPPPRLPEPVPRLPDSITVEPATAGPNGPIPIMPDPYLPVPQPEPMPSPPYPVHPEPVTNPAPVALPERVVTLPPLPAQAHCNPLPTGQPFTNPLHPCQICICRESNTTGKTDVQIECKENPQCVAPADVTVLPPIPDMPMPIPLPICEKFPENVLFPHPTESCKLCKCTKSLSNDGTPEQQITCYPHPQCIPKVEPVTDLVPPLPFPIEPYPSKPYPTPGPIPIEPYKEPIKPMEPVPLPEVVTVEPLPWPPTTTPLPMPALPMLTPRPGPLPGPSPHESCRPYPPNQTFQHPWDDCQVCMCTEATAVGMITVEVNCYTKPSCCIEPPDTVKADFPGNLLLLTGISVTYLGVSSTQNSAELGSLQVTSTIRPPTGYTSYATSANVYPGSQQAPELSKQPSLYPAFVDPPPGYAYPPNFPPAYVNSQFAEYPPRLPVLPGTGNTIGQYKPNNFGYAPSYQYAQGDAMGNNYPPPGHFQPYDPRFQAVPSPSNHPYPGVYQRAMYGPGQLRESYVKPPVPALGGSNLQNMAPSYPAMGYSKSGRDGSDSDNVQ